MPKDKDLHIFWRSKKQRLLAKIIRKPVNSFAKSVICRANELLIIDGVQMHLMAAIIDRSLWPERYVDNHISTRESEHKKEGK